ncbi:hypothetical protein [Alkalibacillus haloalkaliphilus]|uniref:hypothetical protein n=1 Tax=Alkalibacillus haloalkaliphilus TaxID=94136 RepID=UPI0029369F16|nr:hypothetical protein [Alkalibacillus haloalkaliphilus]MDV2582726.1 hypothetical protein [Alkalibacillus haloalkaliphilus]
MTFKLLISFLTIFLLMGCMNSESTFQYEYELNSIEEEDKDEVQKWLNEPDQTPTRTYVVNDEVNNRHYIYGHSKTYSAVDVEGNDGKITLTFSNEKQDTSEQDALVKIKINPELIDSVVLKTKNDHS